VTTVEPTHVSLPTEGVFVALNDKPIYSATSRLWAGIGAYAHNDAPWEYAAVLRLLAASAVDTAEEGEKAGYILQAEVTALEDKVWFTPDDRGGWVAMFAGDW
jgi:hypothetical protein